MKKILLIILLVIFLIGGFLIFQKIITQPETKLKEITEEDFNKKIVILMYHGLVKDSEVDEEKFKLGYEGAPYLYTRKESQFLSDMEYIKNMGYEVISLYDLLEIKNKKRNLHNNAVIITFDDGSQSQYDIAFPILKKHGFKATFFIITNRPGGEGYMSWEELREMAEYKDENNKSLFDIESRSHTHLPLPSKDEMGKWKEVVLFELQTSQSLIEKETGKTSRFLALPGAGSWGRGDEDFIGLAKESGYFGIRMWLRETVDMFSDIYQLSSYPVLNKTETPVPLEKWFEFE